MNLDYDCTLTTSTTFAVLNLTFQGLSKSVFTCGSTYINNLCEYRRSREDVN